MSNQNGPPSCTPFFQDTLSVNVLFDVSWNYFIKIYSIWHIQVSIWLTIRSSTARYHWQEYVKSYMLTKESSCWIVKTVFKNVCKHDFFITSAQTQMLYYITAVTKMVKLFYFWTTIHPLLSAFEDHNAQGSCNLLTFAGLPVNVCIHVIL